MVSLPGSYVKLQKINVVNHQNVIGLFLTVMLTQNGLKISIQFLMTINFSLYQTVKEFKFHQTFVSCLRSRHWNTQHWQQWVVAVWFGSLNKLSHQRWFSTIIWKDWNKKIMINFPNNPVMVDNKVMLIKSLHNQSSDKDVYRQFNSYSKVKTHLLRSVWKLLLRFLMLWSLQLSELLKLWWP